MLLSAERNARPKMLSDVHPHPVQLSIVGQEVIDQLLREFLNLLDGIKLRQRVDSILDGVGRKDRSVVAGSVAAFKVAFELNSNGQLFQVVAVLHTAYFHETDMR